MRKKENMKKIIYGVIGILILTSCYQEIDIEKYREDPKIVMHSFVSDGGVNVRLSKSYFIKDGAPENNFLENASVSLVVNGKSEGLVPNVEKGIYSLDRNFASGDNVRLDVSCSGMKNVSSEVQMPVKTDIEKLEYRLYKKENQPYSKFDFKVTFSDPSTTQDYYAVCLEYMDLTADSDYDIFTKRIIDLDIGDEPLLKPELGIFEDWIIDGFPMYDGIYTFNDRKINGMSYTLNLGANLYESGLETVESTDGNIPSGAKGRLTVMLMKISEGYYKFCDTMAKAGMDDFGDMGFAEPVRIYGNVCGGIGILGAYVTDQKIVYLK